MSNELTDLTTDPTQADLQQATIAEAAAKERVDDLTARVADVRAKGHQPSGGLKKALRDAKAELATIAASVRMLADANRDRVEREAATSAPAADDTALLLANEPAILVPSDELLAATEADPTAEPATVAPAVEDLEATRATQARRRRTRTAEAQAAATAATPTEAPAPAADPSARKQRGKLSWDDALAIVRAVDAGTKRRDLAERYGVHVSTIADILVGRYLKGAAEAAREQAA